MTALSGSEKVSVSIGYLSQFFGMPVILPSMLWKGAGAESPTRPHLARAADLHVLTLAVAFGLVFASSAFSDNDPFKAALVAVACHACWTSPWWSRRFVVSNPDGCGIRSC